MGKESRVQEERRVEAVRNERIIRRGRERVVLDKNMRKSCSKSALRLKGKFEKKRDFRNPVE